ncbi:AI-2E family transporter [Lentisphaera profundi]|uniref:AI-2E family transporter n=1 Tax=Lentisphaera profundi TaxID=1658616 RepID=A0ABY7VSG4_9BACT|nr:AI-2E family transporter [Lentisphaera profundi]WDE97140.1 AI-2E family transporter [Lentisphaera profundi]
MTNEHEPLNKKSMMDLLIRMTLILYLCSLCIKVFAPFALIMLWALIIAIVLYPLQQKLAIRMGGKQGRSATLVVMISCLLIGLPVISLGASLVDHVQNIYSTYEAGNLDIKPPSENVKEWPVLGPQIHKVWSEASNDFTDFLIEYKEPIKSFSKKAMAKGGSAIASVAMFLGAIVIAGFMMTWGESGSQAMKRISNRIVGSGRGEKLNSLSVMTVRSVTTGVIGVAFIQALIIGIGLLMAHVPMAGIIALLVMFLGILQVPAALVIIPVLAYMWMGTENSVLFNGFFTLYFIIGGLSDNVLKPILLGRGVDAPMPVILIGALGGMVASGLIGLFLGATLLAVAYRIFMDWVDHPEEITTTN